MKMHKKQSNGKVTTMIKVELSQIKDLERTEKFFEGIQDSMIISFFQGYMGDLWLDSLENPETGLLVSGEYSFYGGASDTPGALSLGESLFDFIHGKKTTGIFSQQRMDWRNRLLTLNKFNPQEIIRHGIAQKDYVFNKEKLEAFMHQIPRGYSIRAFDKELYNASLSEDWSEEFCDIFASYEEYKDRGFGYGVIKDGVLVSGASTMGVYKGGFETQVATRDGYRKKGLALAASAALLLEGQRRGVRACWDADNEASLHIALKLGYEYIGTYSTVRLFRP